MRVLIDHQIFRYDPYGGISRYFAELAHGLAALQVDVSVCAPLHTNKYLTRSSGYRVWGRQVPLRTPRPVLLATNVAVTQLLALARSPDIIHETYYARHCVFGTAAKRILTVHDLIHEKFVGSASNRDRRRKRRAVERADHIICVSENTRRDLVALLGVAPAKISVVHHGHSFAAHAGRPQPRPTAAPTSSYVLYVGKRSGYKNFSALLSAFAESQLSRRDLCLVCFGGGAFSEAERAEQRRLGLRSGSVAQVAGDDDELARLYAHAAVFVYPSLYEGFGIPPLEAMALGCPVVCSNSSSIPEVVGEGALCVSPDDTDALRRAIESILSNCELRTALVERGRERAAKFTWAKCAKETLDVYRAVSSER